MAGIIPPFNSLVQGLGYADVSLPMNDDAPHIRNVPDGTTIPDLPSGTPSPLQPVSLATQSMDAPNLAQLWNSGDKGDNWMGNPSYPTSKTGTEPVA